MKRSAVALLLISSLAGAAEVSGAPANPASTPHDRLVKLAEDMTYAVTLYQPLRATELGLPGHDGELDVPDEAGRRARIERLRAWKQQLASITRGGPAHLTGRCR
jgi:hypothetical protein